MDPTPRLCDILRDAKYEEIRDLATGSPATDSSIPLKNCKCPWKLVPRELRDEILKYTYGRRSGGLKILFKTEIDLYNELDKSTWPGSSERVKVRLSGMIRLSCAPLLAR